MLLPILAAVVLSAAPSPSQKITVDLQDADLRNVIRLFAEKARLNVMIADDVKGTVTLRLRNVELREALAAVLTLKSLGTERVGSILRVATLEVLAAEAKQRAEWKAANDRQKPLQTRFIPVNYARADELLPHVKGTLSERGRASVDARTNTIIVTDIE